MEKKRRFVFISYDFDNENEVKKMVNFLEAKNIPCWYAPRDIPYGKDYNTCIAQEIEKSEVVIVFITKAVGESKFVPKEIERALSYNKLIIPILAESIALPKNLELFLGNIQRFDLVKYSSEEDAYKDLVSYLEEVFQRNELEEELNHLQSSLQPWEIGEKGHSLCSRVPDKTVAKAEVVFVPPPKFQKMEDILSRHHVVYLHHPYHTGKFTASLVLLKKIGVEKIYKWPQETELSTILEHSMEPKSGYVIEVVSQDIFKSHTEFDELMNRLKESRSYAVLLAKEEPKQGYVFPFSVKAERPDDRKKILLNHVEWLEKEKDFSHVQKVKSWIHSPQADEILPQDMFPREAEEILFKINKLVLGELDEHVFVQSLKVNVQTRVGEWFKQPRSLEDIAFYLATGLLQGQSYSILAQKAHHLTQLLRKHTGGDPNQTQEAVMRDEMIQRFHAVIKKGWRQTEIGGEWEEQVYLTWEEDAFHVWEFVWKQLPHFREPIVEWLDQLLSEDSERQEEKIVEMVVALAKNDFYTMRRSLIQPWAHSSSYRQRYFAVRVLVDLSRDRDWALPIFRLAKSWIKQTNNPRLQWTAIVLLGTRVGVLFYPLSLTLLREAYYDVSANLLFQIRKSLQNLSLLPIYQDDFESFYYEFWEDWFRTSDPKEVRYIYRFAQEVFNGVPKLLFKTDAKWIRQFWLLFLIASLKYGISRITIRNLLDRWFVTATRGSSHQMRLARLLNLVEEHTDPNAKEYMAFILKIGLEKKMGIYSPVVKKLMKLREENR